MILLRPVKTQYPVTQNFGENPQLYPLTNGHAGIDYGLPEGCAVVAAADGEVTSAGMDLQTTIEPHLGYGIYVRLKHKDGAVTYYAHLSAVLVQLGQVVRCGETIGISGNTGRSTGPHLHFELRPGGEFSKAVDPAALIVDRILGDGLFVATLRKGGEGLRVRTGPNTARGIVRHMKVGEAVKVLGVAGSDIWLLTEDGYIKYQPDWLVLSETFEE